jgi:hypothetical protein
MGSTGAPPAAWQGPGIEEVQTAANPLISGRCVFKPPGPALYLFSGYCGVRALQKATGWLRLNQMLWALQIPIIITPILSFAFASGAFVNTWIRLQPSIGYGATALLGSNFTFNLFTPGNTAFGVNLVAVAITYYLTRVQRSE